MRGVEIHDSDAKGILAFDLKDILGCLGPEAVAREWTCSGVECTGDAAGELESLNDAGTSVAGRRLLGLAGRVVQVIDGTFRGRLQRETDDSLVVKAIDSTLWEVFGDDECLARIHATFRDVRPADPAAG